ncbi:MULTISPECIES: hypothetical protein [Bacillus]|uniref:hypothetical protein n=1 Tax=Bacillus TaxID=1386 RepID=UPI00032F9D05|nr:hypothetical protein [Bacillus wiedmannii]EOP10550.1 hypothetical protein ICS_02802 [Bacillus cereus BAG2O-3]EOQ11876.1 hypothetical protein KQ3_02089 [Bacillus cereus B5-2]MBJ8115989.1 hypothetical protein [Bacillus cereus]PFW78893.1 hypothetical protein COL27_23100 [Bacillus sp. AFS075960]RFB13056.1 hypothetical protein DZB88_14105 [Bacillus sp. OE]RFB23662.1 hypothetical protein DZB85_14545 [Bacillus sp. LB(2018)]RFB44598.1 hypothetical protein DZB83_16670 [Bacillus sp. dmp10]RFB75137
MNSFIIFLLLLIAFNTVIFFIAKKYRQIWRITSGIFILSSPIVFFTTLHVIGEKVGDGFAGGAAGLTFSGLLILNAIVLFIISIFVSANKNSY